MFYNIIGNIIRFLAVIITEFLGRITPKRKNLILFHGSTVSNYNESSRYLFEYLSEKSKFDVVWMTDQKKVYDYLQKK